MAEKAQRVEQYKYSAISNLVLSVDRRRGGAREPSGEAESIWDKRTSFKFGDRAATSKPPVPARKPKAAADAADPADPAAAAAAGKAGAAGAAVPAAPPTDILRATETLEATSYRPRTRETRVVYEKLLAHLQGMLGDVPQDVLRGACDEVLAALKDGDAKDVHRKAAIEAAVVGRKLTPDEYAALASFGREITDFRPGSDDDGAGGAGAGNVDEDAGVAVVFDDEDAHSDDMDEYRLVDGHTNVVVDDPEEDVEMADEGGMARVHQQRSDAGPAQAAADGELDPRTIDAFWLQRQLEAFYEDPMAAQGMAAKVMELLAASDARDMENKLVLLLGFDRFDFVKMLMSNAKAIYHATALAQAQTDAERAAIKAQIPAPLLAAIEGKVATAHERSKLLEAKIRQEAQSLQQAGGAEGGDRDGDVEMADAEPSGSRLHPMRSVLDLDALAFQSGGHTMTNRKVRLPEGSVRTQGKGFEEILIPAPRVPPFSDGESLRPIETLPEWTHPAFAGMTSLNRIQSRVYDAAFLSAENMLLCAPTGAGKTNVALLTMLREIGLHRAADGALKLDEFKIVYVAPMKSLVQEMVGNFGKRLAPYGIKVAELTGDQGMTRQQMAETNVIVTTPEKWDIVTRRGGERAFVQLVRLIIIDEIHLLHDDRGPVLEALIARTIRQIESTQEMTRLVGLSATLPNYKDVAVLLRVDPDKSLFFFDGSFRPVGLEQIYVGITEKKAIKRHQLMTEIVYDKAHLQAARGSQVLVFVHSRKDTARTARALRDMATDRNALDAFVRPGSASREILRDEASNMSNMDLKELLPFGFAIHHAGMTRADRILVEDLFADRHIQVLVSTATLAWGVNLPAHTAIIKGTQVYNPEQSRWTELSMMDVMQMLGRAGRPQFDTTAEGIIVTTHQELQFYLSLLNAQLPVESQLISRLPDALNAEIVLGTVSSVDDAVAWLGYTFLYVRMLRNPTHYGITPEQREQDPLLLERRADLVHTAALALEKSSLVRYDRKTGSLSATDLGRVASHYYISYQSMAIYNEHLKPALGDIDLFRLFSLSAEFRHMTVREEEKVELERMLERVPIPIKEGVEFASAKVNVLLQAYISQLKLDGLALAADMAYVTQSATRICRALFELVLRRGWAELAVRILNLAKMCERRMWSSQTPLRQFKSLPGEVSLRIERKDLPWDALYNLSPQELGELIRAPKHGKTLFKYVHKFPRLELAAHVQPVTRSLIRVDITLTPDFTFDAQSPPEGFWILVEDVDGERILHHQYFLLKPQHAEDEHIVTASVPLFEPLSPQYFVRAVSDRWIGAETVLPLSFRHLILPSKFHPPTELLDLQPIPVAALAAKGAPGPVAAYAAALARDAIQTLNPVQTQAFNTLFNSDESALVCAPPGSGKALLGELALLRLIASGEERGKAVFVATHPARTHQNLVDRFEGLAIGLFGEENATNLKMLDKADVVVTSPMAWDILSRRWAQRKAVTKVALYVFDDMHLVGGENGPVLEVIASRARYIAAQTEQAIRIVALGTSLANARDVGDWLGVSKECQFTFAPSCRPLVVQLEGYDATHKATRVAAMMNRVKFVTEGIVFVGSVGSSGSSAAAGSTRSVAAKIAAAGSTEVAVVTKAQSQSARLAALSRYASRECTVLVADRELVWELSARLLGKAKTVVVLDTQYYEGREHRFADYTVAEVLEMAGFSESRLVLLCPSWSKDYYRKFLHESLPVESHLDHALHDTINAEVVTETIENKQDAVDYLTWTFLYRRLVQNPNYYDLQGISHQHLSDHLSTLVENTLADLAACKCLEIVDDMDLAPLNLGMIAEYYYVSHATVELFQSSLTERTKLRGLIEILSSASEFADEIPVRHKEDRALEQLARRVVLPVDRPKWTDARTKANVLLQAHFSRMPLPFGGAQMKDQDAVCQRSVRLLQAMVDVISSNGWLTPALAAMELSQMIVQGMWAKDSALLQLPFVTPELAKEGAARGIEGVFDLIDMEDSDRASFLEGACGLGQDEISKVAVFCNRYPAVEVEHRRTDAGLQIVLEREGDPAAVRSNARAFDGAKEEAWWVVLGNPKRNQLVAIKRVVLKRRAKVKLDVADDDVKPGDQLVLFVMGDSYMGCDQEYAIEW